MAKKLGKAWVARHERDGLDEWNISAFVRSQYLLGSFERSEPGVAVFQLRFQKRGVVMKATLWARERRHNDIVELVIYKGHAEPVEGQD